MGRRALQQHVDGLAEQGPRAGQEEERDQGARDRIRDSPAGEENDAAGHDDDPGADRVAHHLEVGAAYIEALPGASVQEPEPGQIDQEAEHRHRHDGPAGHVGRLPEPLVGGEEDADGHHAQEHAVDEGGEDLDAVVAIGLGRGGGPLREPDREQAQEEATRVDQHVQRVGEEREAARPQADAGLHHQEARGEAEHREQPVLVAGAVGMAMVRVHDDRAQRVAGTTSFASPWRMPWLAKNPACASRA